MTDITIYHNPRCSKSRQALALIEEAGYTPDIVLYLESPLSQSQIETLTKQASTPLNNMVRTGEDIYKELGLKDVDESTLLAAMAAHPKLIQRPIVVSNGRAIVARPPELWTDVLAV